MNVTDLFPSSKFLKSEDIEALGGELTLTISKVERKEYEDEGKKEVKGVLSFSDDEHSLSLNVTNTNALVAMYGGTDIDKVWIGKKITLYVDPNVKYGTKIVKGLRIRNQNGIEIQSQAFWAKVAENFLTPDEGRAILKENGGDYVKSLEVLNGDFPQN